MENQSIRELGIIGDRRTCALVTKHGDITWYCPRRFDRTAFFSRLVDPLQGGYWSYDFSDKKYIERSYKERSAVLSTQFKDLSVEDFMPLSKKAKGICRIFSEAPEDIENDIFVKPYFGLGLPEYEKDQENTSIIISRSLYITASHPLSIKDDHLYFTIPKGETGWAFLANGPSEEKITEDFIQSLKKETLKGWLDIASQVKYNGPYEVQVNDSLRAIQLMTYEENGGIIAAATTSLPEVIGGSRNYDYRYVWLRDSAMITAAMVRADSRGEEEGKFLSFLCDAKYRNSQKILLPFYSLDKLVAQPEEDLPLKGFRDSRPVRIGNNAMDQLQLDANANVLITAKLIYQKFGNRDHWETIEAIADHLIEKWEEKDHGIWEEKAQEHFTSSKVIVSKALEFIADFSTNEEQKERWISAAKEIKEFVMHKCLTKDGAFATYPGSEKVDVTSALFPVWLFIEPDAPEMKKTVELLEKNHREGELYHRTLENYDASKEGVFLAGCFWMAQYYVMAGNFEKAENIINESLKFSNDLGFFGEEGDIQTGEMMGNFPQTFVHASFVGAVIDLKKAKINA